MIAPIKFIRSLITVTAQTSLLLRRDRVFLPAIVAGVLIAGMANIIVDWAIEDFLKILYDVGAFGFALTGGIVAIFWGTKIFGDARTEGSLEVQLAAPVGRTAWLIGKFLGLVGALILLWVILLAFWQALMLANNFGWLNRAQLVFFAFQLIGWIVVATVATLFSTFCTAAVAMFSSISLWIIGLATNLVASSLAPNTPDSTKVFVKWMARCWDLGQFNLVQYVVAEPMLPVHELLMRAAYGVLLVCIMITAGCVIFNRRDII